MEEFMTISEEHQQDIAEYGRTIICIIDEQNSEKNRWSYSIGNSISENPTPELLCFFPHRHTVSWILNQLSDSLRLEEIKPLSPGEVVEVRGVLGDLKEFPLLLKYLTPDEQRYCWDNFTYRLNPDVPVIQVEIPDTAGYYSHEPGSPSQHVEGHTPERLAITKEPDRFIYNLWGAPENPVTVDALRDNLRYLVSIFLPRSDEQEQQTPATLQFLHYLAEREFDFEVVSYGEPNEATEQQTHHDVCVGMVQTLLNLKEALECLNTEDYTLSPFGADKEYERYWYGIKPTPEDLGQGQEHLYQQDDFTCNYDTAREFVEDLNWELIRYVLHQAYEDSLDAKKTTQYRIDWKMFNGVKLTEEEWDFSVSDFLSKKPKRFTVAWLNNKIKSLFSK